MSITVITKSDYLPQNNVIILYLFFNADTPSNDYE